MKNTSAALQVAYEYVEESIEPLIHNSLPIAALTTAYGRVHLFEALHRISPENLLYAGERIVCIETFLSISLFRYGLDSLRSQGRRRGSIEITHGRMLGSVDR